MRQDDRVLAAYSHGSVGLDREDDLSDVDPVFVVRADSFDAMDADLPAIFAGLCKDIVLWWPERGNCETWKNYAILFRDEGCTLQYDVTIETPPADGTIRVLPHEFVFDKVGLLEVSEAQEPPYEPTRLLWTIGIFWVYAYIHVKYLKRRDTFKVLYSQKIFFDAHVEILRAIDGGIPNEWWPITANALGPEPRDDLLLYFGRTDIDEIAGLLKRQFSNFSRDAQLACSKWNADYPHEVEAAVREHLDQVLPGY